MANTAFTQLAMLWLDPGKSWHLNWNNAHYNRVYAFNVSPIAESGPVGTTIEAEVLRVWRVHTRKATASEAEVHVIVKNTSSSTGGYCFVFMSTVGP